MGVDFYICSACEETFPDCGGMITCGGCGNCFGFCCMDKYNLYGEDDEADPEAPTDCPFCTFEKITTEDLLDFALKEISSFHCKKVTRKILEKEYRAAKLSERESNA